MLIFYSYKKINFIKKRNINFLSYFINKNIKVMPNLTFYKKRRKKQQKAL